MNANLVAGLSACLVGLSGCYQLPRQTGTWKGQITSRISYDFKGGPHECAVFVIVEGPRLKPRLPTSAVLVKKDLTFYTPGEIPFSYALLRGTLGQGFPRIPSTGDTVTPVRGEPFDLSGILIVKKAEPVTAPTAAPPHR